MLNSADCRGTGKGCTIIRLEPETFGISELSRRKTSLGNLANVDSRLYTDEGKSSGIALVSVHSAMVRSS